ncbi:glycosyltransferase family 4 protein [Dysgonomonas sp. HDW5A]|uniref:glycosyltransferase family 4 protein n=1 Tax=Dysgonomonas sp. HDW5A TaxID=2714926 RepID=UPI001409D36F|nr:glycosyltransferase family 4 protein [Dysgonomonas sp. HDW5A]QIK59604.1 glycosyltransferase family 4 protein [Dysgonomonas sp. HDW5A]
MEIVIFDAIYPLGHRGLNKKLVSIMSKDYNLILLNNNKFYKDVNFENVTIKNSRFVSYSNNNVWNIFLYLINVFIAWIALFQNKFDKVIFFTFDTVGFFFCRFLFFNKNISLFHHNNTDHLQNPMKRKIFSMYMNKVNHIVFAGYIKDYLVNEIKVDPSKVFVLTHPIIDKCLVEKENDRSQQKESETIYIGLGYSNDQKIINDIIQYEEQTKILEEHNIKLILRSQINVFDSKNIKVIKGFLSREEYDQYYNQSSGLIVLYPSYYKCRYSGSILEAFNSKKRVFGNKIPIVDFFSNNYPENCIEFGSIRELFEKLLYYRKISFSEKEYKSFLVFHSEEKIRKELISILL